MWEAMDFPWSTREQERRINHWTLRIDNRLLTNLKALNLYCVQILFSTGPGHLPCKAIDVAATQAIQSGIRCASILVLLTSPTVIGRWEIAGGF